MNRTGHLIRQHRRDSIPTLRKLTSNRTGEFVIVWERLYARTLSHGHCAGDERMEMRTTATPGSSCYDRFRGLERIKAINSSELVPFPKIQLHVATHGLGAVLTCLMVGQSVNAFLQNAADRQLVIARRRIAKVSDAASNDNCPHPLLRHPVIGRIDYARLRHIITGIAKNRTGAGGLHSAINRQQAVDILNQEYFGLEMADYLNVAKQKVAQLRMVKSCALEVLAGLVKPLIGRNAE